MKWAAVKAIAELTKQPVPELVLKAYGVRAMKFGNDYLIPKPLDPRLITAISPAVAKAAMDSKVSRIEIDDWDNYSLELEHRIGIDHRLMSRIISRARGNPKKVVFAEADDVTILKAAQMALDERVAEPILMGNRKRISRLIDENELADLSNCQIIDPHEEEDRRHEFAQLFFEQRQRKGMTYNLAKKTMTSRNYFGAMMVNLGHADALISGLTVDYPKTILPALQIIGMEEGVNRVAGMYIISGNKGNYFFADTTVNLDPNEDEIVDIIGLTARAVRFFDAEPRIAGLSYSNFGSAKGKVPEKMAKAVAMAKERWPDLKIDGDLQANVALNKGLLQENYPFSDLAETAANTLVFPNLESGNIAYKIMMEMGGSEGIGPILMGMKKSVHVLQVGSSVRDVFNMAAISVVDAQTAETRARI